MLVSAVTPRVRRRSLKIQLRTGVVGNCVRAHCVLGRIVDVDVVQDGEFRLVGITRVQVDLNARLAEWPAVESRGGEILPPDIVGAGNCEFVGDQVRM